MFTCTHTQRGRAEESPNEDKKRVDGELGEDEQDDDDDLSVDPSTSQPPGPGRVDTVCDCLDSKQAL